MTEKIWVGNRSDAINAYWKATSRREQQAAYHEILLFGGKDGYPSYGPVRTALARWLRIAAMWMDGLSPPPRT